MWCNLLDSEIRLIFAMESRSQVFGIQNPKRGKENKGNRGNREARGAREQAIGFGIRNPEFKSVMDYLNYMGRFRNYKLSTPELECAPEKNENYKLFLFFQFYTVYRSQLPMMKSELELMRMSLSRSLVKKETQVLWN